jgi:CDP-paratose 2-epimerase
MALEYADAYGFRCVVNRCGLISGPRQMGKSDQGVIVLWLASHYFGSPLRYIGFGGSGKQVRDVLHIDDFCDLVVDEARNFERYAGRPLNAGGGTENSVSLLETTELCAAVSGRRIEITPSPETRPADVKLYITDNSKVSAINGWRPKRNVRGCLEDVHGWLRSNEEILKATLGFG